jgi:hypothetical protein
MKTVLTLFSVAGLAAAADTIRVAVDPRLELVAAVESLSGASYLTPTASEYRRQMEKWFRPWADHPAVRNLDHLWLGNASGPASAALCLSDPPELAFVAPAHDCPGQPAGGPAVLEFWVRLLRDFAAQSEFATFFAGMRQGYRSLEAWTRRNVGDEDVAVIEEYFGTRQRSYTVAISPLVRAGYGPGLPAADGRLNAYAVVGTPGLGDRARLRNLLRHEFGHSFTNPAVRRNRALYEPYDSLFAPLSARMHRLGYGGWQACVFEHVLRAAVARMALHNEGPGAAARLLAGDRSIGFLYIDALYERLAEYEGHAERYPTFDQFVPRLLEVFRDLAAKQGR